MSPRSIESFRGQAKIIRKIEDCYDEEADMLFDGKCKFELIDRSRDMHGTKADWHCTTHRTRAGSEAECRRELDKRKSKAANVR